MPKATKLTPVEWEIMDAVWELGGLVAVREVLERAYPRGEKAYTTVQTVMNTLQRKGLLDRVKKGGVNLYQPTLTRQAAARGETATLVARVFGGSIPALANSLMSLEDISSEELEQIKDLIARKEAQLKGGRE